MEHPVGRDFTFALRQLRRAPVFTVSAVLTLALGLGLAASLGSVLNALVLRTLPVDDPDRLVVVSRINPQGKTRWMPLTTLSALARDSRTFESVCGYAEGGLFTTDPNGSPVQSPFEFVSGGCYAMAGVKAHIGRLISERDAPLAGEPARVAVLGYGFWQRHFGRDPAVLGRTIRADDLPLTIIGVTPPGFAGLQVDVAPDITVPATLLPALGVGRPGATQVNYFVARLRADVTVAQARSRVSAAWPAVQAETMPGGLTAIQQEEFRSSAVHVESLEGGFSPLREEHSRALALLGSLAGLLLVLTIVNLSGLLLARTAAREHELAVRAAMGASGPRLAVLVVAEALVLAGGGVAVAVPFAYWASATLGRMLWTGTIPLTVSLVPDWRVLGAIAAMAVIIGVAMSAVPAWSVSRRQESNWLRGVGVGARAGRWARPLVLIQVAVSLVLVFGATLFVRSLVNLDANRTGSAIDQLVLARLAPLPSSADDAITPSYYPELIRRVSGVAGVRSASLSRLFPGISDEAAMFTKIAAAERPLDASAGGAVIDTVSPGFFASAGIPLLRGRDFAWQDGGRSPSVAIVNVSAARRLFASSEAVGRRIRIGTDPSLQSVEVIGLVDDAMIGNVRAPHVPVIMRPLLQNLRFARYSAVVIRTDVPGEALTRAVQRAVATLGKDYVSDVRPAKDMLRRSVAKDQVMAALSLLFGGVAVAIAFVGVFGAMALDVSRRRREIGVRMALGADRQRVARSVIGKALTTTAWGTALGVPCALAASSAAGSLLYGLAPSDPVSLAGAGMLMVAVCALGSLVPALRAAGVDPVITLRAD